jgi:hypothetical protein
LFSVPVSPKKENLLLNLTCNIVVPTVVLIKFSSDRWLGPVWGLVAALAFPVGYGVYDLVVRRKTNVLSILGFASVLLSGGLGLLKVNGFWFAVKDAVLPTVIGLGVLVSGRAKNPLLREIFYNDQLIDTERIDAALAVEGRRAQFDALLRRASAGLGLTFIATAPIGFFLARHVLKSPPGTAEFNAELGRMHWLMPLVVSVPMMAALMVVFWKLLTGMAALTGLTTDEILRAEKPKT